MKKLLGMAVVATLAFSVFTGQAMAGDAAKGEKVAKKCLACHDVTAKKKKKVGPPLWNMAGAAAGQVEGFKYSTAMKAKAAEGLTWDDANLDQLLANPKKFMKGTKMAFPGLKKEADRANVIAFMKTLK